MIVQDVIATANNPIGRGARRTYHNKAPTATTAELTGLAAELIAPTGDRMISHWLLDRHRRSGDRLPSRAIPATTTELIATTAELIVTSATIIATAPSVIASDGALIGTSADVIGRKAA